MKKFSRVLILLIIVVLMTALSACTQKGYRVTFKGNGSVIVSGEMVQYVQKGSGATAPVFEKEGHTLSWDKTFNIITSDIVVNAIWTINSYQVTFDGNDGEYISGEKEQTINHGSGAVAPVFEKNGFTLSWDKTFDNIKSETTITAVWTPIRYKVIFDDNDNKFISGDTEQGVDFGSGATSPIFAYPKTAFNKAANEILLLIFPNVGLR